MANSPRWKMCPKWPFTWRRFLLRPSPANLLLSVTAGTCSNQQEQRMSVAEQSPIVWAPSEDVLTSAQMGRFKTWLEDQGRGPFADYHALHQWSVDDLETFWAQVWDYCGLICDTPASTVLGKRE